MERISRSKSSRSAVGRRANLRNDRMVIGRTIYQRHRAPIRERWRGRLAGGNRYPIPASGGRMWQGVEMTLSRIGRFEVQRPLGSGSFATVWLARDEDLDAWVAIKLLAENWSFNQDARRRFIEEARALRRLDSERIVRVYDVGSLDDSRPYMADRGTLEDRIRLRSQLEQP